MIESRQLATLFVVEFDGNDAGNGAIERFDDGAFGYAWERPDGMTVFGMPFSSERAADEALTAAVDDWYRSMQ
jgi:hypothetical protein